MAISDQDVNLLTVVAQLARSSNDIQRKRAKDAVNQLSENIRRVGEIIIDGEPTAGAKYSPSAIRMAQYYMDWAKSYRWPGIE